MHSLYSCRCLTRSWSDRLVSWKGVDGWHTHELSVSHTGVIHMSKPGRIITNTITHSPRVSELTFKVWPFKCCVLSCGQNTIQFK